MSTKIFSFTFSTILFVLTFSIFNLASSSGGNDSISYSVNEQAALLKVIFIFKINGTMFLHYPFKLIISVPSIGERCALQGLYGEGCLFDHVATRSVASFDICFSCDVSFIPFIFIKLFKT